MVLVVILPRFSFDFFIQLPFPRRQLVPQPPVGENEASNVAQFLYEFEWDPAKAKANRNKHGVDFQRAAQIFRDPLAVTIPDEEHSDTEARWITLGRDMVGRYVLSVHTFEQVTSESARIRLISARPPTSAEVRAYEEER
jgi:uncharacterized DUF497 family protein